VPLFVWINAVRFGIVVSWLKMCLEQSNC